MNQTQSRAPNIATALLKSQDEEFKKLQRVADARKRTIEDLNRQLEELRRTIASDRRSQQRIVDFETQVKALHAKIEELELGVAGKHLECQDLQDQLAAAMELLDEVPTNAVEGVDAPDQQLLVDLANAQERIKHVEQAHASTKEDLSRARSRIALVESREAKDLQELAKIREEIAELRRVKVSLDEALTAHVARPPFFGHSEIVNRDAVRKLL